MSAGLAYLDTSAFIKLIVPEPESKALEIELRRWPHAVASELLEIEAARFGRRYGGATSSSIGAALRRITLVPIGAGVRTVAATLAPPELRTLDAIHLATALDLGPRVEGFFAYDRRLAGAATASGLSVLAPA